MHKGKTTRTVPFAELSFDDLRAAARAARGRGRQPSTADAPLVRELRDVLRNERLGSVGVRLQKGKVDLTGIPVEELRRATQAIARAKLPL